jgi:hypothetical protein
MALFTVQKNLTVSSDLHDNVLAWSSSSLARQPLWGLAFLRISEQFNFYGMRLPASRLPPNLEDLGIPLWLLSLDLSGRGGPSSSYDTAGIALRVSGARKPHHHDKVGIASVGHNDLEQAQFPNVLSMNACTVVLQFLNNRSTAMRCYFISTI